MNHLGKRVSVAFNPDLIYDYARIDPATQSVRDVFVFQPDTLILTREDPVWLITLNWDPQGDYTPRRVGIRAEAQSLGTWGLEDQHFGVWEGADSSFGLELESWLVLDRKISFDVVPSPGAAALAPVAIAFAWRRRRA